MTITNSKVYIQTDTAGRILRCRLRPRQSVLSLYRIRHT